MKTTSLTRALFIAGAIGLAGAAQADVIFYPDGTSVELGESGADVLAMEESGSETLALDSSTSVDTTVLGAGSSSVTATTTSPSYVYVQPNINWDRSTAMTQLRQHRSALGSHHLNDRSAAGTFNVPSRAGEVSTMTGGAPNMVTDNNAFVVGSRHIPYGSITTTEPYYVMSF
ncbi:MAG TPA: hypothetical protein VHL79_12525 [Ramlibacter sp.]|jgi:hypothetical protein|nr:hypothetical protein [Ramlibacter sp.]